LGDAGEVVLAADTLDGAPGFVGVEGLDVWRYERHSTTFYNAPTWRWGVVCRRESQYQSSWDDCDQENATVRPAYRLVHPRSAAIHDIHLRRHRPALAPADTSARHAGVH